MFSVPHLFKTSPDKQPSAFLEVPAEDQQSEFLPLSSLKMVGDRNRGPWYHLLLIYPEEVGKEAEASDSSSPPNIPIFYSSDLNLPNVVTLNTVLLWWSPVIKLLLLLLYNCDFAPVVLGTGALDHQQKGPTSGQKSFLFYGHQNIKSQKLVWIMITTW